MPTVTSSGLLRAVLSIGVALASGPASATTDFIDYSDGLLLRYSFNEGSGTALLDTSGWARDADTTGSGVAWVESGLFGNSIDFDAGESVALDAATSDAFRTPAVTVSVWINPDLTGSAREIVGNKDSQGGFYLRISNGKIKGGLRASGNKSITSSASVTAGVWTHVVYTADDTGRYIYFNGLLDKQLSAVGDIEVNSQNLTIGHRANNANHRYDGQMDELRIYDRALTQDEITGLANTVGGEGGLIFYESFDNEANAQAQGYNPYSTGATFIDGLFDGGLQIDSGGGVSFPAAGNLDMDEGSISFWYRPDWDASGSTLSHTLLQTDTFCDAGTPALFRLNTYGGFLSLKFNGKGPETSAASVTTKIGEPEGVGSFVSGEWHRIEMIWDGTAGYMIVAVDGVVADIKRSSRVTTGGTAPTHLFIGRSWSCAASWNFKGTIDELKIYDTVNFKLEDVVSEYEVRSRDDGKLQPHENVHNSPDASDPALVTEPRPATTVFFTSEAFDAVFEGKVPSAAEQTTSATWTTVANDFETLFFNVYTPDELGDTTVTLVNGKLVNGGNELTNVKLRAVRNWWQVSGRENRKAQLMPTYIPELLVGDDRVHTNNPSNFDAAYDYRAIENDGQGGLTASLPSFATASATEAIVSFASDTARQFALTVAIPAGTPAGSYTGTVALASGGSTVASLPVTLVVEAAKLIEAEIEILMSHLSVYDEISCWDDVKHAGKDKSAICRNYLAGQNVDGYSRWKLQLNDLRDHGFNGVMNYNDPQDLTEANALVSDMIWQGGMTRRIMFSDEHPAGDFGDYSQDAFDAVAAAQAVGFVEMPATFYTRDEPGFLSSLNQDNRLGWHLDNVFDLANMGAHSVTSLFYDVELCLRDGAVIGGLGCEDASVLANLAEIWNRDPATNSPLAPTCSTVAPGDPLATICDVPHYPQMTLPAVHVEDEDEDSSLPAYEHDILNGAPRTASTTELVYWQTNREDPRANRYFAGYFMYLTGFDGLFPFTYMQVVEDTDPYNDFDPLGGASHTYGGFGSEHMLVYPSADGPIVTMQWEALREGLDDYRHAMTWAQANLAVNLADPVLASASASRVENGDGPSPTGLADFRGNDGGDGSTPDSRFALVEALSDITNGDYRSLRDTLRAEILLMQAQNNDGDAVNDYLDSCITVDNPSQLDTDGDGIGNMCDVDFDNNCVVDWVDGLTLHTAINSGTYDELYDVNEDGVLTTADQDVWASYPDGGPPGPNASLTCY